MKQKDLQSYQDSITVVHSLFPLLHEKKYTEAENLLLELLTVILRRNEVIVEDSIQYQKDRGALLHLDLFFDVGYDKWMLETFGKENHEDGTNELLLQCAKNKQVLEKLIHEIFEYLCLRTHFYPYKNLVQALAAYRQGKKTSALDENNRMHYAYDSECDHCRSFVRNNRIPLPDPRS